jgi:hypothetical protein
MATEAKTETAVAQASPAGRARSRQASHGVAPGNARSTASLPFLGLQQTAGNQAVLRLLASGALQAKLRVSQPGDPDEIEADRVAEQIVSTGNATGVQRKCACAGGASCAKCAGEEEETVHRSAAIATLSPSQPSIQRAPSDQSLNPETAGAGASGTRSPTRDTHQSVLIVEDNATQLAPGQMKRSQFMRQLRSHVCATADAALAGAGRSSKSCPYIEEWLGFYSGQSGQYIERALHLYAPETAGARRAQDYLSVIANRVRQAVTVWAKTGKVTGVPAGVPFMPGPAHAQGVEAPPVSGAPGRAGGAAGASSPAPAPGQNVLAKRRESAPAQAADTDSVQERLGAGRALDSSVRSRMEPAFGHDFSRVRLHTDANAAHLSTELNARAFTVGENVAFATGEYKPGTPVGDALIAHELAHVVQQGGAEATSPRLKGDGDRDALEEDADNSAVGAVTSLWTGAKGALAAMGRNAVPRLKSGLKLQACRRTVKECPRGLRWAVVGEPAATGPVCICAWRCLPPGVGYSISSTSGDSSGPSMSCANPDQFGRCPGEPDYVKVDADYEKREDGRKIETIVGVGAHMSPLGEQAACGCLPLDIEGDATGEKQVNAPLLPPGIDITDVLAPAADMAAAAKNRAKPRQDSRTGAPRQQEHEAPHELNTRPTVVEQGEPNAPHATTPGPAQKTDPDATGSKAVTPPAPATAQAPAPITPSAHDQAPAHAPDVRNDTETHPADAPQPVPKQRPDPEVKTDPGGKKDPEAHTDPEVAKGTPPEHETDKPDSSGGTAQPAAAPVGEAQIDRVQHLENETQRLSQEAKVADPTVKEAKSRRDQAAKAVSDLSGEVAGYQALTDEAAKRNPALKDQVDRANRQRDKLAKAQKELVRAKSKYDQLDSEQSSRYEKIRSNNAEIEKIARPELALKPTLRGVANELRVLKEEGLLGIKKSFTLRDPKTGEVATTIPDGMRSNGRTVDVKDVLELSETQQLRLQREVSRRARQKAEIITGTKTKVPAEMETNYLIKRRPDLGPR